MTDLQFNFPWWLVLIILAGSLLFLFQFRQLAVNKSRRMHYLLLAIQLAAFLLMVFQMSEPAFTRKQEVFHNPVIVIAWDNSLSFQSGRLLRIHEACQKIRDSIASLYRAQGFEVVEICFNDTVMRAEEGVTFPAVMDGRDSLSLTDFTALLFFVQDSLKFKNIQALFLFSDGWNTRNTDQLQKTPFPIPVFPIILPIENFNDRQLDAVVLTNYLPQKGRGAGNKYRLNVDWLSRGHLKEKFEFQLSAKDTLLFKAPLEFQEVPVAEHFTSTQSFLLNQTSFHSGNRGKPVFGLISSDTQQDDNPYNDTLRMQDNTIERLPGIFFLNTVKSLDEAWMLRILQQLPAFKLDLIRKKSLAGMSADFRKGQLWLNTSSASSWRTKLADFRKKGIQLVFYGSQPLKFSRSSGSNREKRLSFGPAARVTIAAEARQYFSSAGLKLEELGKLPVRLPVPASGQSCLITVEENKTKGCLLLKGRIDTVNYYRLSLTGFWNKIFNPRESYLAKTKIRSLIQGTATLVNEFREETKINTPDRLYDNIPFSILVKISTATDSASPALNLLLQQGEKSITAPLHQGKFPTQTQFWETAGLKLNKGSWRVVVRNGNSDLWEDFLYVESGTRLEMGQCGFNLAGLKNMASSSGGAVMEGRKAVYPKLPGGQEKETQLKTTRFSFFKSFFFAVLFLMTLFWSLRKRMTLD